MQEAARDREGQHQLAALLPARIRRLGRPIALRRAAGSRWRRLASSSRSRSTERSARIGTRSSASPPGSGSPAKTTRTRGPALDVHRHVTRVRPSSEITADLAHPRLVVAALAQRLFVRGNAGLERRPIVGAPGLQVERRRAPRDGGLERRAGDVGGADRHPLAGLDREHQLDTLGRGVLVLEARQDRRARKTAIGVVRLERRHHVGDAIGGRQRAEAIGELAPDARDRTARPLPVTETRAIRRTGVSCQRSGHALVGRRREHAHVLEAAEADEVIDGVAHRLHLERFADARLDQAEHVGIGHRLRRRSRRGRR